MSIFLIPKVDKLEELGLFRPISLCNVMYKVISKMLANRLRIILPEIVSDHLLEYVRGLLGLGWLYSPLVLVLIRDKGRLLKGQVSLAWELSKPLYIRRGDVSI